MKRKFTKILGIGLVVVLLFSLATIPALATISGLSLTLSSTTISNSPTTYTLTFNAGVALADGQTITVTFPTGANIASVAGVTVEATAGIGGTGSSGAPIAAASAVPVGQVLTITTGGGTKIGAGSIVQVVVPAVANPGTVGTYTLTVATATETTAVSATFATVAPTISPLPGIVKFYNTSGVPMGQFTGGTAIAQAIAASLTGYTIEVGPGTYTENPTISTTSGSGGTTSAGVILKATGTAAETIIIGNITISAATVTIDGFTIAGNMIIGTTGDKATIKNCIFTKTGTGTTAETLITYGNTTASGTGTITANTIDTSLGAVQDTGILVNQLGLTISNNTFVVDGATVAASDSAINVAATAGTTTITGNTISGASGIGVTVSGAGSTSTITSNTLSNLNVALNITAVATVTVQTNTIDACGLAVSATLTTGQAAIQVAGATALSITNNTITNCPNDIIEVDANADLVNMMFNNMSGNTLGVDNNDGVNTVNATHNWWGAATGPATGANAGLVSATGALGTTATGTFNLGLTTLTAATTQKVDVAIVTSGGAATTAAIIGVANYSANPGAATPYPAISGGFFDVYVGTPGAAADVATIKFYGAVTADTVAYVYSTLQGQWAQCTSQGVNTTGGYVWVKTGLTITPAIGDLAGTAFALVTIPASATLAIPTNLAPEVGATDIPLSPTFAWSAVTGAAGYYFQMADNANFVAPLVKLDGDLGRLIVTAYHYVPELEYSTAYYWRVKSVSGTVGAGDLVESAWVSGVIITMDEPEEPLPPVVIEQQPAAPAPIIEPIVEVITPAATPITPAWIYAIIAVGAVMIIAVIVLIVRTRRVA